jgi:hypothetical protein
MTAIRRPSIVGPVVRRKRATTGAVSAVDETLKIRRSLRLARIATVLLLATLTPKALGESHPLKTVLLYVDFDLVEMSAGSDVRVRQSVTNQAVANLTAAIERAGALRDRVEIVHAPSWTDEEATTIRRHCRLALLAANTGLDLVTTRDRVWKHIAADFPYSVGDGLGFVADRTASDAALIVSGYRSRQDDSRIALMTALSIASIAVTPLWILPPFGVSSRVLVVLLNLRTGQLRWANWDSGMISDPSDPAGAERLIGGLLEGYPLSPVIDRQAAN